VPAIESIAVGDTANNKEPWNITARNIFGCDESLSREDGYAQRLPFYVLPWSIAHSLTARSIFGELTHCFGFHINHVDIARKRLGDDVEGGSFAKIFQRQGSVDQGIGVIRLVYGPIWTGPSKAWTWEVQFFRNQGLIQAYRSLFINPKRIKALLGLSAHFAELVLKDPSRPKGGHRNPQREYYANPIGYLGFLSVQMEPPEPSNDASGKLGAFWIFICCVAIIFWIGGGLAVWRGAHIADNFLSGGLVVICIGTCFMGLGLWLLRKVFRKLNPPAVFNIQPKAGGNTVTQKLFTSPYFCNTLIAIGRAQMANVLSIDKQVQIIGSLAEGCGIRQIERMTGVHRDTIMRLGVRVGQRCAGLLDRRMRDLSCNHLQFDEIWGFIGKKERHRTVDDDYSLGDVWTFCAIDDETKLVPSFKVGKRDAYTANAFVADVASRVKNRVQISADALRAYVEAIEISFGKDVDFAQIVKTYEHDTSVDSERKFSAPEVTITEKRRIMGRPDMRRASTNHVERLNGTTRLHMRR